MSPAASNFTNGAIKRNIGNGGTIRVVVKKKRRVVPQKTRTVGKLVVVGGENSTEGSDESVCESGKVGGMGGVGGEKDGGPLFISVPQALLGICMLRFRPKCNLSAGLIQSVRSSSVQTQSLSLMCNPPSLLPLGVINAALGIMKRTSVAGGGCRLTKRHRGSNDVLTRAAATSLRW